MRFPDCGHSTGGGVHNPQLQKRAPITEHQQLVDVCFHKMFVATLICNTNFISAYGRNIEDTRALADALDGVECFVF